MGSQTKRFNSDTGDAKKGDDVLVLLFQGSALRSAYAAPLRLKSRATGENATLRSV